MSQDLPLLQKPEFVCAHGDSVTSNHFLPEGKTEFFVDCAPNITKGFNASGC